MEENNKKSKKSKKKIIITTSITILLLVLIVGITYAVWNYNFIGNSNVIETGEVSIEFLESNDVIAIENAIPLTDEEGEKQFESFEFQVTTKAGAGISLKYDLNIEKVSGPEGYTSLKDNEVKVYLTDENNNPLVGPTLISNLSNYNLYSKINSHTENSLEIKDRYKIRVWIDEGAEDSYDWSTQNNLYYNFKIGVSSEEYIPIASNVIIAKVGTDGLVAEEHQATEQLEAVTDYRYTGANPNNYVSFNNELWRIIGVFPTDDGIGNIENRVKIIRNESIGDYSWDNKASGTGSSTSSYGSNDWSDSALQIVLNEGAYYNRTTGNCPSGGNGATKACDFSTTGLTEEAKGMISDAKWYLGGPSSDVTTSNFYSYERGTTVYSGRPTSFIGKIGLMYPSDYGYATSGGSTTSREECLATELYNWDSSSYSDCKNNDWLYNNNSQQWAITPYSGDSFIVFGVYSTGYVSKFSARYTNAVRPVLYLDSMVEITGGTGTSSDPYTLGI